MRFFPIILIFLYTPFFLFAQNTQEMRSYTIMFYNVENLFDTVDDPTTNDDEFTPHGERHWTSKRLDLKIERIAKVIVAAGKWENPAIIGLCEVENLFVLEKLTSHPLLKKSEYRIIHKDSPDHRSIDVAFLYRKELFNPINYSTIPIINENTDTIPTREILHVEGNFLNGKEYHFFVNHWPSRYGGLMETEGTRRLAAKHLKSAIDEIRGKFPEPRIICMGDFNDQPDDESLCKTLGALSSTAKHETSNLINLSQSWSSGQLGTIKHQQDWAIFDQFIISENLVPSTKASILNNKFLLEPDTKFTGFKPNRTYIGYRYNGGCSDHLPILLTIQK